MVEEKTIEKIDNKKKIEKVEILSDGEDEDEYKKKEDLYPVNIEEIYHKYKKMFSAGVLEDEKNVMDEILAYKKSKNLEEDFYIFKKDLLDGEIQKIQNMIIQEVLTLDGYKSNLNIQMNYEKKLLEAAKSDKNLSKELLEIIEKRINKRIEIINSELQQEVPEEESPENEAQVDKKNEESANTENKNIITETENKPVPITDDNLIDINRPSDVVSVTSRKVVEIKDMFLYETLKKRLIEYKLAIEYFEKNNLQNQEKDAIAKVREIQKAMIVLEDGKDIDDITIPESINPEYISGYSKEQRFEKFTKLIKEYNNIKNEIASQRNRVLEKFNQLQKKEQNKIVSFNLISKLFRKIISKKILINEMKKLRNMKN